MELWIIQTASFSILILFGCYRLLQARRCIGSVKQLALGEAYLFMVSAGVFAFVSVRVGLF